MFEIVQSDNIYQPEVTNEANGREMLPAYAAV
jgi:hypothetical protein